MRKYKSSIYTAFLNKLIHNDKPTRHLVSETTRYLSNPKYIKNKKNRWIDKSTGRYVSSDVAESKRSVIVKIFKVKGHYEGFVDDKFICSGDTYPECSTDLDMYLDNLIK